MVYTHTLSYPNRLLIRGIYTNTFLSKQVVKVDSSIVEKKVMLDWKFHFLKLSLQDESKIYANWLVGFFTIQKKHFEIVTQLWLISNLYSKYALTLLKKSLLKLYLIGEDQLYVNFFSLYFGNIGQTLA